MNSVLRAAALVVLTGAAVVPVVHASTKAAPRLDAPPVVPVGRAAIESDTGEFIDPPAAALQSRSLGARGRGGSGRPNSAT